MMSFFKKNKTDAAVKPKTHAVAIRTETKSAFAGADSFAHVLCRPRITEKAGTMGKKGVYAFEVSPHSSKRQIALAVQALYKVTPIRVRTVAIPPKRIIVKGKKGVRSGGKKAYVFLKKGEKIEVI